MPATLDRLVPNSTTPGAQLGDPYMAAELGLSYRFIDVPNPA